MAKFKDQFEVVRDSQEKKGHGWTFEPAEYGSAICLGTRIEKLPTGDYTLVGYEELVCVERKATVAELAMNFGEKRWPNFLGRMENFEHKLMVFEFQLEDVLRFPLGSRLPREARAALRVTPNLLLKHINEIVLLRKIPIVFAGSKGKEFVASFFKRVIEHVQKPLPAREEPGNSSGF